MDKSEQYRSMMFGVVLEVNRPQRCRCEVREGVDVFVFDSGGESKTVVRADEYLAMLDIARKHKYEEGTYGIPNHELV